MVKSKKMLAALALASAITGSGYSNAVAEQAATNIDAYYAPIQFEFDGSYLAPPKDQQGFLYKDSTYVPLRFVAYSIDKAVDWDPATYTVTIREPAKAEKVTISEYKMNRKVEKSLDRFDSTQLQSTAIPVYFESVKYVFDGLVKQPIDDLPGLIYEGSLYVPLRFVSELVGRKIEWDPATYTVKAALPESAPKPSATPSPSPTAAPTPSAPAAGGGGGGGSSNPSYTSLYLQVIADLGTMKLNAESTLTDYQEDYAAASTPEEKAAIENEARTYYDQVVNQFNERVNAYESQLSKYGYETSSADDIRKAFEDTVDEERAKLGQ